MTVSYKSCQTAHLVDKSGVAQNFPLQAKVIQGHFLCTKIHLPVSELFRIIFSSNLANKQTFTDIDHTLSACSKLNPHSNFPQTTKLYITTEFSQEKLTSWRKAGDLEEYKLNLTWSSPYIFYNKTPNSELLKKFNIDIFLFTPPPLLYPSCLHDLFMVQSPSAPEASKAPKPNLFTVFMLWEAWAPFMMRSTCSDASLD